MCESGVWLMTQTPTLEHVRHLAGCAVQVAVEPVCQVMRQLVPLFLGNVLEAILDNLLQALFVGVTSFVVRSL